MAIEDYLAGINNYTGGAKAQMESAGNEAARVGGESATLPFKLKEALQQKLDYNKDIIGQSTDALGNYIAAPAQAREQFSNVWDPFKREALVANARSEAFKPYQFFQDILGQRMGQVSDIVGQGVAGWQGIVQQAQALAQLAQQKYAQAYQEYMGAAGMQSEDDARRQAQENWQKEYDFKVSQANKSGSGSSSVGVSGLSGDDQAIVDAYISSLRRGENPDIPAKYQNAVMVGYNNIINKVENAKRAVEDLTAAQEALPSPAIKGLGEWFSRMFSEKNPRNKYPFVL